jgi:hypothetical protein
MNGKRGHVGEQSKGSEQSKGQDSLFVDSSRNLTCGRPRGRRVEPKPSRSAVDAVHAVSATNDCVFAGLRTVPLSSVRPPSTTGLARPRAMNGP